MVEQAVLIHFEYGPARRELLDELDERIEGAILSEGAGEYFGHELATDERDGWICVCGPDPERLLRVVRPIVEAASYMRADWNTLHLGPLCGGLPAREVRLGH